MQKLTSGDPEPVRIETVVGRNLESLRRVWHKSHGDQMSQSEFGSRVGQLTGKPWSRQAVSAAENGDRAFTLSDLACIALVLEVPITSLLLVPDDVDRVGVGGQVFDRADLVGALLGTNDAEFRARVVPILRGYERGVKELNTTAMGLTALIARAESAVQGADFDPEEIEPGSPFAFLASFFVNPGQLPSNMKADEWMGEVE